MALLQARVLVIDRHTLFGEAMAALLRTAGVVERVASATTLAEVPRLVERLEPTVVFLDPGAHEQGPIDAVRHLDSYGSAAALVFLDDTVRLANLRAAIEVSAAGYWTKHASLQQILFAMESVLAGEQTFCPGASQYLISTPDGWQLRDPSGQPGWGVLSRREFEVLLYLVNGLTVKQCAERMHLAESTVDNHKARLMRKLGIHRSVDLVRWATREGLLS